MVASSVEEVEGIPPEEAGSEAYQEHHMGRIFTEGLSFSGNERDRLFLNDGAGAFTDLSALSGLDDPNDGRSAVLADFDDDGDQDLFVHNIARARHRLYRNDARGNDRDEATGGFVKVRLEATSGAPEAVGAVVRLGTGLGTQAQVLAFGNGFLTQGAPELVFGLGGEETGTLTVTWPGRKTESFGVVGRDQRVLLIEGKGKAQRRVAQTFAFADPTPPGLKVDVGDRLEAITVLDVDGRESALSLSSEGETYLNFWASWCSGCKAEAAALDELDQQAGVQVIAVSVDVPEERSAAASFLQKRGLGYQSAFISRQMIEEVLDVDRLTLPTTLVLDSDGTIQRVIKGRIDS